MPVFGVTRLRRIVAALCFVLPAGAALADQGCNAAGNWPGAQFSGEAYGEHAFEADAGPYRLVLEPAPFGWRIAMEDDSGDRVAVFAPPLRPVETNPLNIAGWHFRNADNTGPNRGEVNAPQTIRKFTFGALATDPAANPELIAPGAPAGAAPAEGGHGELIVEDYGLADLEPGERARMVYLKFSGCVDWDPGDRPATLADTAAPGVAFPELAEAMAACGLDAGTYRLSDRMAGGREGGASPYLEPDMDGDGAADLAVPVDRLADGAPGLAICLRGGNTLHLAGYSGRIGPQLDPAYFGSADYWAVHEGPIQESGFADGPRPAPAGDAILLGKEGASSVLLLLDGAGALTSYWQGD